MNYLDVRADIEAMDKANVDFYHIDMMDGNYVPNLCLNYDIIKAVRSISTTPMDVHIMALNPYKYLQRLSDMGVEYISAHLDTIGSPKDWISAVHNHNAKAGIVLNIDDDLSAIEPVLDSLDLILVMAVKPGFSGQSFNQHAYSTMQTLKELKAKHNYHYIIEVDGGVGWDNIEQCTKAGAELAVAGVFAVFGQEKSLHDSCVAFKKLT